MSNLQSHRRRANFWRLPILATAGCILLALAGVPTPGLAASKAATSTPAAQEVAQHVFVEVSTADAGRSIYVQQQAPYTVRLYFDDTIRNGELAAPNPADAVVEQLGEEKHGTTVRDGRRFNVIERNYAIAPEKSGVLRIPPVTFSGVQVAPQSADEQPRQPASADPADELLASMLRNTPFANDPLIRRAFSSGMLSEETTQPISAQSAAITVDVKQRPAAVRGDWLPAEAITLHDSWRDTPPRLKAGEPATRIITIEAKGLSASQIPPLSTGQPANARLYPDAADNESRTDGKIVIGTRQQKVTYIPDAQGKLNIPAVDLAWWDVVADAPRVATLPSMSLNVAPNADLGAAAGTNAATAPTRVIAERGHGANANWRTVLVDHRTELALAALAAALLAAFGVAMGRSRRRRDALVAATGPESAPQRAASLRALDKACAANDPFAAATALLDLGQAQWPNDPPRGLGALASRLEDGAEEVGALNRHLFGATGPSTWQGDALRQAMRGGLKPRRTADSSGDDVLQALYPVV